MAFAGAALAALGGAATGYQEGQEAGMKQQLQQLALGEGQQQMQMNQMELDRRKALLKTQSELAEKMKNQNTAMATDPQGLAQQLGMRAMEVGDFYSSRGFTEEGEAHYKEGVQLLSNAAQMQQKLSEQQVRDATITANAAGYVLGAKDHQKAQDETMAQLQKMYPNAKFQVQPGEIYSEAKWKAIQSAGTDARDKAYAQAETARATEEYAAARYHNMQADKLKHDMQEDEAVAAAVDKEGGKKAPSAETGMILKGMPLNQVVPGWGKDAVKERKVRLREATNELMSENPGMTRKEAGEWIANKQIEYGGEKTGAGAYQRTVQTRAATVEAAIESMKGPGGSIRLYESAAQDVDFGKFKPFKTAQQWYEDNVSDPKLTNYMLKANALAMEYAQVMQRSGRGGVADREHALELIAKAKTPEQAMTIGNSLLQEAGAIKAGTQRALKGVGDERPPAGSRDDPYMMNTDEDYSAIPPGKFFIGPDGQMRQKKE